MEGLEGEWKGFGGRKMTKTLNRGGEDIIRDIQMKKNKEYLKLVLGSKDRNYVLFISFRNLLNRIKYGRKNI